MQTNRTTACLLVISVQAVDQYRQDPRLNEVIYGRITVTGQQLPIKKKLQLEISLKGNLIVPDQLIINYGHNVMTHMLVLASDIAICLHS